MESWLKKSPDNVNKCAAGDGVEAAVNTNASRVFLYALGTSALLFCY